jgi:hypothetical protein
MLPEQSLTCRAAGRLAFVRYIIDAWPPSVYSSFVE